MPFMCAKDSILGKQNTTNDNTCKNSGLVLASAKLCTVKYKFLLVHVEITDDEVLPENTECFL